MVVIQYLKCPVAVMSACGLVGWMSKLTLFRRSTFRVGTHCPLGWQRNLVFEDHLGIHLVQAETSLVRRYICSSNLLRLCLKLSYVFCSSSGSQVGFHETSTILKVDTAFLFILIQIYTGRAGP